MGVFARIACFVFAALAWAGTTAGDETAKPNPRHALPPETIDQPPAAKSARDER
jgi:hypothetical protein